MIRIQALHGPGLEIAVDRIKLVCRWTFVLIQSVSLLGGRQVPGPVREVSQVIRQAAAMP